MPDEDNNFGGSLVWGPKFAAVNEACANEGKYLWLQQPFVGEDDCGRSPEIVRYQVCSSFVVVGDCAIYRTFVNFAQLSEAMRKSVCRYPE